MLKRLFNRILHYYHWHTFALLTLVFSYYTLVDYLNIDDNVHKVAFHFLTDEPFGYFCLAVGLLTIISYSINGATNSIIPFLRLISNALLSAVWIMIAVGFISVYSFEFIGIFAGIIWLHICVRAYIEPLYPESKRK